MEGVSLFAGFPMDESTKIYNILLVDEDMAALRFSTSMLEMHHARVTPIQSAYFALSLIEKSGEEFDEIMIDVKIKEMDIFTFMGYIRSMNKNLMIVLITSYENEILPKKALRKGASFIFQKPIHLTEVNTFWKIRYLNEDEDENSSKNRIPRIRWIPPLQTMFMQAIRALGERAPPKAILNYMNVPGLTVRHLGSHLQKYRSRIHKKMLETNLMFPPNGKDGFLHSILSNRCIPNFSPSLGNDFGTTTFFPSSNYNGIEMFAMPTNPMYLENFQPNGYEQLSGTKRSSLDVLSFNPNWVFENHPEKRLCVPQGNLNIDIIEEKPKQDKFVVMTFQDFINEVPYVECESLLMEDPLNHQDFLNEAPRVEFEFESLLMEDPLIHQDPIDLDLIVEDPILFIELHDDDQSMIEPKMVVSPPILGSVPNLDIDEFEHVLSEECIAKLVDWIISP